MSRPQLRKGYSEKKDIHEKTWDADMNWVLLMNDRYFIQELMRVMIKESKREDCVFGGTCIYANSYFTNLNELVDKNTIDLIYIKGKPHYEKNEQGIYKNYKKWLTYHKPRKNKLNIYFIGEAHGDGNSKHVDIHWNCYIIDTKKDYIYWFDPSIAREDTKSYNFDSKDDILRDIYQLLNVNFLVFDLATIKTPQRICQTTYDDVDVFCQTWVLMFASAFINRVFNGMMELDYDEYFNEPLKMWSKCMSTKLSDEFLFLSNRAYNPFFEYRRTRYYGHYKQITKKLPKLRGKGKLPCIFSVITHYLKPDKISRDKRGVYNIRDELDDMLYKKPDQISDY